jgi:hypothetical protein
MLTRTRTTIITLIAAGSFATATVAPAVSQAQDGGSGNAGESCEVLAEAAGIAVAVGTAAATTGHYESAANYFQMASDLAQKSREQGCGEAAAGGHSPNRVVVAPKGGAVSTPPVTTKPAAVRTVTLARAAV